MDEKIYFSDKFLDKAKDLANGQKFETCPPRQSHHWVTRMWVAGVIGAIYWSGYEIVKKSEKE